jgi:hypothetical protein
MAKSIRGREELSLRAPGIGPNTVSTGKNPQHSRNNLARRRYRTATRRR